MSTKKQFQGAIEQLTLFKEEKEAIKTTHDLNTDLTETSIKPDADLRQQARP